MMGIKAWCPGRDLNPGLGLERPESSTGLDDRFAPGIRRRSRLRPGPVQKRSARLFVLFPPPAVLAGGEDLGLRAVPEHPAHRGHEAAP